MRDAKWRIREALARRFVDALKAEGIRGPEGSLACLTMREWGLHWSTIPEHTPARRYSGRACDVAQRRLMMRTLKAGLVAGCLVSFCGAAAALEVGDKAPDFQLPGADGKTYRLSDYTGKQAVVLAWFPKANTYGCTIECKSLAENGDRIRQYDVTYFMASVDPLAANIDFAEQTNADFPLLSDEDKSVAKAYGVLSLSGVAKRQTFYIGKDGQILKIDRNVTPETSAEDMVQNLQMLGVDRVARPVQR